MTEQIELEEKFAAFDRGAAGIDEGDVTPPPGLVIAW